MGKYDLAYSGERLEYCSGIFERLADTYENILTRGAGISPVSKTYALQLRELSRLLKEYAGLSGCTFELDQKQKTELDNILRAHGIEQRAVSLIEREDGNRELQLSLKATGKKCPTTREVAMLVEDIVGNHWVSSNNNRIMLNGVFNSYTFVEGGRFTCVPGIARSNKAGNVVSGDSVTVEEVAGGKTLAALSDGMGTGTLANEASRFVLDLMEDGLRAGFKLEAIMELINTTLAVNEYGEMPITLDVCVVDAVLGIAHFVKLGAVATFVKRKEWVELIQSETLPMGVLNDLDYDSSVKKMYAGDYIIMVSDGILEELPCVNKEKALMDIIAGLESRNPEIMAQEILSKVLEWPKLKEFSNKDDMTVLVIGLYER